MGCAVADKHTLRRSSVLHLYYITSVANAVPLFPTTGYVRLRAVVEAKSDGGWQRMFPSALVVCFYLASTFRERMVWLLRYTEKKELCMTTGGSLIGLSNRPVV